MTVTVTLLATLKRYAAGKVGENGVVTLPTAQLYNICLPILRYP